MLKSSLFGRRVHIAGSISSEETIGSTNDVKQAREMIELLVKELLRKGATFVIPVDAEKFRSTDNQPICFDWLIWETLYTNLHLRPTNSPSPLVIAVQHHKNEEQIPAQFINMWDTLRISDLINIDNVSHWNMNCKRMEAQARWGDILIALGGAEGVLFLANLYHDAGKPVIPLNLKLTSEYTGARHIFKFGLIRNNTQRLFHVEGDTDSTTWINKINFKSRHNANTQVQIIINLLESLERPKAFAVRLLNTEHEHFIDVQNFFDTVVQPVIEDELGYKLVVIDGKQPFEYARIDQEIFAKLHRSSIVIADITGWRPNCFIELGYALGRGLPTLILGKDGTDHPFDINSLSGHRWKTSGTVEDRRRTFRDHWNAVKSRPPLVQMEPLIP